jgi:biofilm PGA synthesis N-glycosyltransferase PgaC
MGAGDEELRERAGGMSILIFLFSVAFILYVLAGYPLILAVWAKAFPRPIRKEFIPQTVSVIVPVRNGARWVEAKIQSLLQSEYPGDLLKILIVSDGSTDGTEELVRRYPDARVGLLALPPGGKATAVNHGLENVTGELIVLTDVRQAFDPSAIHRMAACFADPSVGVVTGELVIREGATQEQYNTGLYWQYEKWIRRNLNRIDAMLGATGSIYAIRRELAVRIPPDILLDDVYVPFAIALRGRRIYFEDDAKAYDLPTSLNTEFWRKVRTQAGVYQILFRFPALLSPFNRRFIHFLSHKLGRLLLPFAMLTAAASSFFLPQPWRTPALIAQGLFYLLAISDPVIPEKFPLKRLSAVIRAFVVLTAAAFCALAVFILPAQKLWKETR